MNFNFKKVFKLSPDVSETRELLDLVSEESSPQLS